MLSILLQLAVVSMNPAPQMNEQDRAVMASVAGRILQADARTVVDDLRRLDPDRLEPIARDFRSCVLTRLSASAPGQPKSPMATSDQLRGLFQEYWRASVLDPESEPIRREGLRVELGRALGLIDSAPWGEIESAAKDQLLEEGVYSQFGITGRLRDFMAWRDEVVEISPVNLPTGEIDVEVRYLDGFVSLGWTRFLSCNTLGTGGWATEKSIFAMTPAYASFQSEAFRVNLLAHESQHFLDKSRFLDAPAWRLEYRAKLVELIYAETTFRQTLLSFISSQSDDPDEPHSFANRMVVEAVGASGLQFTELSASVVHDVKDAAAEALARDSNS